jgi:hypothetical protein
MSYKQYNGHICIGYECMFLNGIRIARKKKEVMGDHGLDWHLLESQCDAPWTCHPNSLSIQESEDLIKWIRITS